MKKTKITIFVLTLFLGLSAFTNSIKADGQISPYAVVVPCSGSFNSLTKTGVGSSIAKSTGIMYVNGSTATVTQTHTVTLSNSATFNLIPEFLTFGYSTSITAGNTIGWSKTNKSGKTQQLVVKSFYDVFTVRSHHYQGNGLCNYSTSNKNIYTGWGYDLV